MTDKEIAAKVATVVNETQLAFNAGSSKGVTDGSEVRLYRRVVITDPDTKEELGAIRIIKLRMRVTLVAESYCVAVVKDVVGSESSSALIKPFANLKTVSTTRATTSEHVQVDIGEAVTIVPN